jgi:hypothetical protein
MLMVISMISFNLSGFLQPINTPSGPTFSVTPSRERSEEFTTTGHLNLALGKARLSADMGHLSAVDFFGVLTFHGSTAPHLHLLQHAEAGRRKLPSNSQ